MRISDKCWLSLIDLIVQALTENNFFNSFVRFANKAALDGLGEELKLLKTLLFAITTFYHYSMRLWSNSCSQCFLSHSNWITASAKFSQRLVLTPSTPSLIQRKQVTMKRDQKIDSTRQSSLHNWLSRYLTSWSICCWQWFLKIWYLVMPWIIITMI